MTHSAGLPQRLYKCCFLCKAKIIYVSPIDTADADDGHKGMRLKSSDDKVIEAAFTMCLDVLTTIMIMKKWYIIAII